MENFFECEYKYRSDDVSLEDFRALMKELPIVKNMDVSSWDLYYTKDDDKFQRFRNGTTPELTKKVKIKQSNNWERIEVDLPLDPARISEEIVRAYVEIDGYKENFKLYKTCSIYWLDNVNFVYYIVYDKNMKEQGRFIEVEVNKDKVTELGDGVMALLNDYEKLLSKLNITHKNRLKKSLFEIFKNE